MSLTLVKDQFGAATIEVGVEDLAGVRATDIFLLTVGSVNDPVQVAVGIPDLVVIEDLNTFMVNLVGVAGAAFSDNDLANGGDSHTVTVTSSNPGLVAPTNSPLA